MAYNKELFTNYQSEMTVERKMCRHRLQFSQIFTDSDFKCIHITVFFGRRDCQT